MTHGLVPKSTIVLAVSLALAGCGGGGVRPDAPAPGGSQSPPPMTRPDAPASGGSQPPPPMIMQTCVQTADLGCLSPQAYQERRAEIERRHAAADDFGNQWGLSAIRADRAWAQLELEHGAGTEPGSGQTVGLIDSGIDTQHPVFDGKTVTEYFFRAEDEIGDRGSHGTAVASVIAASPSATFTDEVTAARGVAPGADIAMFAIPTSSGGGGFYVPIGLRGLFSVDFNTASWLRPALEWSSGGRTIDFVNMSVGYNGIIDQYSEPDLRTNLDDVIDVLAQSSASEKTVFVWAAGNAHGDSCNAFDFASNPNLCVDERVVARSVEVLAGLPARIPELRGHVIAAVAIGKDGAIASFSNRCGIAADWCVAAPGEDVRLAYFGPHPDDGSPGARDAYTDYGTSFAAPMVTGGLVVMKHYFRDQLSNTELVARLLATANKQGIYANPATYGQGLMDLGAATTPVGATRVARGERVDGTGVDLTQTGIALGNALGDGLTQAFARQELVAFDDLDAPFWFSLGEFAAAAPGPSVAARLDELTSPANPSRPAAAAVHGAGLASGEFGAGRRARSGAWRFGLLEAPGGAEDGHLGLAGRALGFTLTNRHVLSATAFTTPGEFARAPASGASLAWQPVDSAFGLHSGWVGERKTLLGSSAEGAFGTLAADAFFAGIRADTELGGWRMSANAEIGTVAAAPRDGLITGISPLTTSALSLRASRPLADDGRLHLSVSQPLRVERGRASLDVPVGRTKAGEVVRSRVSAELAPSGRQIDVSAQWRRPLDIGELRLGAVVTRQPGHRAAEGLELTLLTGWRWTF